LDRQQSLARDLLKQKLKFAAVDPVAVHDEAGQGIVYQLGERAPGDVHTISPRLAGFESDLSQGASSPPAASASARQIDQSDLSANGPWRTQFVSANWRWPM
jgi:hypothetical protein